MVLAHDQFEKRQIQTTIYLLNDKFKFLGPDNPVPDIDL